MEIHRPKPVHNWRELASEIGVIVVGILIALSLEQAIESYHARERAEIAREAIRAELRFTLAKAITINEMQECSEQQLAVLSEAIGSGDPTEIRRVVEHVELPSLFAWSDSAWQAALASNVTAQFDERERASYSLLYDIVNVIERLQEPYADAHDKLRAIATTGLSRSPDARSAELVEMAALIASMRHLQDVARVYPTTAQATIGLTPTKADFDRLPFADQPDKCRAAAETLNRVAE